MEVEGGRGQWGGASPSQGGCPLEAAAADPSGCCAEQGLEGKGHQLGDEGCDRGGSELGQGNERGKKFWTAVKVDGGVLANANDRLSEGG